MMPEDAGPVVLAARCPGCDAEPLLIVGDAQAFCGNEDCRVFAWDRTEPPERFKATARTIDFGWPA